MPAAPTPKKRESWLIRLYMAVRLGPQFLGGIILFCIGWLTGNHFLGFDPGLGIYNSILSTEASLSTSMLGIEGQRQYEVLLEVLERIEQVQASQDRRDGAILDLLQAQKAQLTATLHALQAAEEARPAPISDAPQHMGE